MVRTCATRRQRILLTWLVWQVTFSILFVVAQNSNVGYFLNQMGWAVFGPPESVYSFANLWLHRLIMFALISSPPTLFGITVYQTLLSRPVQFSLRSSLVGMGVVALLCAFLLGDPNEEFSGRIKAVAFVLLLLASICYLYRRACVADVALTESDS